MPAAKFALRPDPEHPGLETIMVHFGDGKWVPVRRGRFSDRENEISIKVLAKRGIKVERAKS